MGKGEHSAKEEIWKIICSECSQILVARHSGIVLGSGEGRKIKIGPFYVYGTEERG
jgi:hypothetical protein